MLWNRHFLFNDRSRQAAESRPHKLPVSGEPFGKLADLASQSDGFIYSSIVLQHLRPKLVISYLQEFARLLSAGGVMVFQMPSHRNAFLGGLRMAMHLKSRFWRVREQAAN